MGGKCQERNGERGRGGSTGLLEVPITLFGQNTRIRLRELAVGAITLDLAIYFQLQQNITRWSFVKQLE